MSIEDPQRTIQRLRSEVESLQLELSQYRANRVASAVFSNNAVSHSARAQTILSRFWIMPIKRLLANRWPRGLQLAKKLKHREPGYIRDRLRRRFALVEGEYGSDVDYRYSNSTKFTKNQAVECKRVIDNMAHQPTFSIVMPVYNVAEVWLVKAIESVLAQVYERWELCIVDDASTAIHIRSVLTRYAKLDNRIKVTFEGKNTGISAASNVALAMATGDYIALLDNDDELAPHALYENAKLINQHPEADFIYSDEDKIDTRNAAKDPFFKPDWSPDYFHACMYTCHLGVYRTQLLRKIGGFRGKYDGAQDYDLVLRVVEKTQHIFHIPKILYHWRVIPSSAASGSGAKPWAYIAAQRALQSMLGRSDYPGWVDPVHRAGFFRVRREIKGAPLVSIVIPSAGTATNLRGVQVCLLEQCLRSIYRLSTYNNVEIIVVDGYDIPRHLLEKLEQWKISLVRCDRPFNFSERMNLGVRAAKGDFILMLNDDTEVITPSWIETMLEFAQQKEIGAVGAKLFYPNGLLQHAGVVILAGSPTHAFHQAAGEHEGYYCSNIVNRNYLGVTGACLMIRREVFEEVGGFDEDFPLNFNDVDLCLRLCLLGYRSVFTPFAQLIHYESISRGSNFDIAELHRLHRKFRGTSYMQNDPYYSSNLSMRRPFFETAIPQDLSASQQPADDALAR